MLNWPFAKKPTAKTLAAELQELDAGLTREMSRVLAHAGVRTLRQAFPELSAELDRARRYRRPLAILLVTDARLPDGNGIDSSANRNTGYHGSLPGSASSPLTPASALITALIGSVLRDAVREADIVTYASMLGRCMVMMPEVSAAEAPLALARVGGVCASRLMFPIRAGVSAFPQDGWTLEELIRRAEQAEEEAEPIAVGVMHARSGAIT